MQQKQKPAANKKTWEEADFETKDGKSEWESEGLSILTSPP